MDTAMTREQFWAEVAKWGWPQSEVRSLLAEKFGNYHDDRAEEYPNCLEEFYRRAE